MNPEEVIELLKIQREDCSASVLREDDIDLAIQALDKQIEKKPKISDGIVYEGYEYCPSCDMSVTDNYCGNCGQRIDWGNDDEA